MAAPRILAFSGSLRKDSNNTRLARLALEGARAAGAHTTFIELRDYPLPVFDEDLEARDGLPLNGRKLKDIFLAHDGLIIASPEYNSSLTAALKNTIDWLSRSAPGEKPLGCFDGKVCGLLAASPGALGGLRGLVHLRAILGNIKAIVLPDQIAIPRAHEAFQADGALKDASQQQSVAAVGARVAQVCSKLLA